MTKKDKILYRYISNIVNDEKPDCIQILTSRDISELIKRIDGSGNIDNVFQLILKALR